MLSYPCRTHDKTAWVRQIYSGWRGFQRCRWCRTLIMKFYFFFEVFISINFSNRYIIHVCEVVNVFCMGTTNGKKAWIRHNFKILKN